MKFLGLPIFLNAETYISGRQRFDCNREGDEEKGTVNLKSKNLGMCYPF